MQDSLEQLLMSRPKQPKRKRGPKLRNIEAGLWKLLKTGLAQTKRKIELDRIEAFGTLGFPDVLCCNEDGLFSFLELKVQHGKKINLSPHQCSGLSRHSHSNAFVVVRDSSLDLRVFLGGSGVDLALDDFDSISPYAKIQKPYDWEAFWDLTCPRSEV